MSTLIESIRTEAVKLATLRHEAEQRDEVIKRARAAFEQTIAAQLQTLAGIRREIEATEGAVRGMALVTYEQSGEKKPVPGVEIVVGEELVYDEADAWKWAQVTGMCMTPAKLDVKSFAKIAKAAPLPFVEKVEKPSVRIASDLLKKLESDMVMPWDNQEVAA